MQKKKTIDWENVKKLMQEGEKTSYIAHVIGLTSKRLCLRCIQENGMRLPQLRIDSVTEIMNGRRGRVTGTSVPLDWDEVDKLILRGTKAVKIAAKFNVSNQQLYSKCKAELGQLYIHYRRNLLDSQKETQ